jgi:hypothetical protein
LLAHGPWFSLGTLVSSTTKTGRHDIAEILLKVALNTKNQSINQMSTLSKRFEEHSITVQLKHDIVQTDKMWISV